MNSEISTRKLTSSLILGLLMVFLLAGTALADDPPGRVMRLKYVSGQVSFQPGGVNDWAEAVINRPLTTADRLWVDRDSRAELNMGTAALRIQNETSMTLTNLDDNIVQVELDQGTLNLHVRQIYPGETYEIDTPNIAFTLQKPGDYRFEVDSERGNTTVIVRRGEGEGTGEGSSVNVRSGQEVIFENGSSNPSETVRARRVDEFDDWCHERDKREDRSDSLRYVPSDMVGYEDLDQHGRWENSVYGPVWIPSDVGPGWAPYHYGHWVWIEPWGWTWVDDAPWGFAPFHYGRWVNIGGYWGWSPGPSRVRAVYAPALVAWVGGRNWGISISIGGGGGVGWVPLGYGEAYYPTYRVSNNYVRNVNVTNTRITNITNVTNNYTTIINNRTVINERHMNQAVNGGMTVVSHDTFVNARPVAGAAVRINARDAATAPAMIGAQFAPVRGSVLGVGQGRASALPPPNAVGKPVWAKQPPPARPVAFDQRQPILERNGGQPLDATQLQQLRTQHQQGSPGMRPASGAMGDTTTTQPQPGRAVLQPGSSVTTQPTVVGRPNDRMPNTQPGTPAYTSPMTRPGATVNNTQPQNSYPRPGDNPQNKPKFVGQPQEQIPNAQTGGPRTTNTVANPAVTNTQPQNDTQHQIPRPPRNYDTHPQNTPPVTYNPPVTTTRPVTNTPPVTYTQPVKDNPPARNTAPVTTTQPVTTTPRVENDQHRPAQVDRPVSRPPVTTNQPVVHTPPPQVQPRVEQQRNVEAPRNQQPPAKPQKVEKPKTEKVEKVEKDKSKDR